MTPEQIRAMNIASLPGTRIYQLELKVFMLEEVVRLLIAGLHDDADKALRVLATMPSGPSS